MVYRKVRTLSPQDAAYIAGLIDGEGTVTLSRRHAKDRRQLVVSISSTEASILDWVLVTVGAGKITRKAVTSAAHAPGLTFTVSNRQALDLLEQTSRLLRSYKRLRAEMILQEYVALTPRNGRYTAAISTARAAFEKELLAITANPRTPRRSSKPHPGN